MEELFNILSSSARIDKSKRKKKRDLSSSQQSLSTSVVVSVPLQAHRRHEDSDSDDDDDDQEDGVNIKSRDRTGKRDTSQAKLEQVHKEQITAFRRSMNIKLANKHDDIPDPISSFQEMSAPSWWSAGDQENNNDLALNAFRGIHRAIQHNIEVGKWKEPTPIQMQGLPLLMERRDLIGAAPTGSGKSGAFLIPALFLGSAPHHIFYGSAENETLKKKKKGKATAKQTREGEIRSLVLAPSLELASQLHREVERLGSGKPGGVASLLLSKSNAALVISGTAGGKHGLDVLVSTPLRLVDSIEKGLKLGSVRLVVLDEADRLLDATDGGTLKHVTKKEVDADSDSDGSFDDDHKPSNVAENSGAASGSTQSQTFLAQMDIILSEVPASAVRALFSATVTPTVRMLSESILRNPVDVTIANSGTQGGANPDIEQELVFVGREEGKLLAIRQFVARGQLRPPVIIFLQSQERAQALFGELLYDGIHVDVIHAGRSRAARESAVQKFRKGDTWVLICTDLVARGVDFRAVNMVINYDLPTSGVTYVHRIGRTGRAGRKGKAITLFTEADFDHLRTIANVMKQSGCDVQEWMLNLPKSRPNTFVQRRQPIDTTPSYDKKKRHKKQQMVQHSKTMKMESKQHI